MSIIKNYDELNITDQRKIVLDLIEKALISVDTKNILDKSIKYEDNILYVNKDAYDMSLFKRIVVLGIGKGSSAIVSDLRKKMKNLKVKAFSIDVVASDDKRIDSVVGTHPLTSDINSNFTKNVIDILDDLDEEDLVISVICGGGSALFEYSEIPIDEKIDIDRKILQSGAGIYDMNTLRKHLSLVKGGNLAKIINPAKVISLIFSDVLGNDLSFIASGPLVYDSTTIKDAIKISKKFHIDVPLEYIKETPKEENIFNNINNYLLLTNDVPLQAMLEMAKELGIKSRIISEEVSGIARDIGCRLIEECRKGEILLAGGESSVVVRGQGRGGRNQELVAGAFGCIEENTIIVSFGTDGWDNYGFAGAIADKITVDNSKKKFLDVNVFLDDNNTYPFFKKLKSGIDTGKLSSNVSDLMIVYKF